MRNKILVVYHPVGKSIDRATGLLESWGYELDWCCPAKGHPLPEPGGQHVAALVQGGAENLSESGHLAYLKTEMDWIRQWVSREQPVLGICLGGQLMAQAFGKPVKPHPQKLHEIGFVEVSPRSGVDDFLAGPTYMYQWHQEGFEVPERGELLATGERYPNQAYRIGHHAYGLQFHPEVAPENFLSWIEHAGHYLDYPGAHSKAKQESDAVHYDAPMRQWLKKFLKRWLTLAGASPTDQGNEVAAEKH
ncbi:MAG: glutamine amidotransferase [Thiotrichales bacterium]|nr:glutamine amidotransferase [Thiotrichales bacterium]